jgi:hypothetical protein
MFGVMGVKSHPSRRGNPQKIIIAVGKFSTLYGWTFFLL